MDTIKKDFEMRRKEIENYILFLHTLEENNSKFISFLKECVGDKIDKIALNTTSRATTILLLYNLVEAMVTKCLKKIHEVINSESINYAQLSEQIRKIVLNYYANAIYTKGKPTVSIDDIFTLIEIIMARKKIELSYIDMTKYYPLYSGNLDAKKIKSVMRKYGVSLDETNREMQEVKNKRNILAHGELSFEEIGRDISLKRIDVLKEKTFTFLSKMVESVEAYISNKAYLLDK